VVSHRDPRSSIVTERELIVLDSEPGQFVFGAYHNVAVCAWAAQANTIAVSRLGHAVGSICRTHTEGVSMLHMIMDGSGVPAPEARDALVALASARAERVASIAVAVLGSGFWASAMRSFVTGVRIACPRGFELGIHASVGEAVAWLPSGHAQRTGVYLSTSGLTAMAGSACDLVLGGDPAALVLPPRGR
jgi:hypothetical protein